MAFDTPPDFSEYYRNMTRRRFGGSPEANASIASGGLGILEAILRNRAQANEGRAGREQNATLSMNNLMGEEMDQDFNRARSYMDTFNMDPTRQQRGLFGASALADLAQNGAINVGPGGITNPFQVSQGTQQFMSPGALEAATARFHQAAGQMAPPGTPPPNMATMGFNNPTTQPEVNAAFAGAQQRYQQQQQQRRRLLEDYMGQQNQGGGGFGSILAGILGGAASFAPMLFGAPPIPMMDYFNRR